jgi:hypothetical protein
VINGGLLPAPSTLDTLAGVPILSMQPSRGGPAPMAEYQKTMAVLDAAYGDVTMALLGIRARGAPQTPADVIPAWIATRSRVHGQRDVAIVSDRLAHARSHWVEILDVFDATQEERPVRDPDRRWVFVENHVPLVTPAAIHARVSHRWRVEIECTNVARFRLYLRGDVWHLDTGTPVSVFVNGVEQVVTPVEPSLLYLIRTARRLRDPGAGFVTDLVIDVPPPRGTGG